MFPRFVPDCQFFVLKAMHARFSSRITVGIDNLTLIKRIGPGLTDLQTMCFHVLFICPSSSERTRYRTYSNYEIRFRLKTVPEFFLIPFRETKHENTAS